jgi:hypothetical protein
MDSTDGGAAMLNVIPNTMLLNMVNSGVHGFRWFLA